MLRGERAFYDRLMIYVVSSKSPRAFPRSPSSSSSPRASWIWIAPRFSLSLSLASAICTHVCWRIREFKCNEARVFGSSSSARARRGAISSSHRARAQGGETRLLSPSLASPRVLPPLLILAITSLFLAPSHIRSLSLRWSLSPQGYERARALAHEEELN